MNKKCTKCGKEYQAKRETSKYCSSKCNKAHQRLSGTVSGTSVPVTADNSVPVNIPDKDANIRAQLVQFFKDEGKPQDEIDTIMQHQDHYYDWRGYYFVPARFTRLISV